MKKETKETNPKSNNFLRNERSRLKKVKQGMPKFYSQEIRSIKISYKLPKFKTLQACKNNKSMMRKSSNRKNRKYFSRLFNETRLCKTINNKIRTKNRNNRIKINNKR